MRIIQWNFVAFLGLLSVFGTFSSSAGIKPLWNATWTDNLKRDLFMNNYDKFARPEQFYNTTNVEIGLTILHVDVEEAKSIINVNGWIKFKWNDPKLRWNESDYGGLTTIHVSDHEIWQPDIVLYNSASGNSVDHYGNTHSILNSNGDVLWVPPYLFKAFCSFDLSYWPLDQHTCRVVIGSWTYNGNKINLDFQEGEGISLENMYDLQHEWEIIGTQIKRNEKIYVCCPEPYVDISYNITISRRTPMYKALVVTPVTVIVLLTLATFWLPSSSGEKILLNGVVAVFICLYMFYLHSLIPAMTFNTPYLVHFLDSCLYLTGFSTVIAVIVISLSRNRYASSMPWAIKSSLDGRCGRILGLHFLQVQPNIQQRSEELREPPFEENNTPDDRHMIQPISKSSSQHDWILFATAIDRLTFVIYCFIYVVLATIYCV
ncbi:acetylcholine receptor subunit alpha-like 1 [Lutzomyia longipalpis]|uniref:acetylcholine receptor subunit alpha-like 1 n=1 Tax=Lutzomyia longipalpis TaxID=7200 RepID=UPI0024840B70|nr:acetylcholine receptor subunit alpha-like 1 [Lutzomyia longipalpis]